MSDPLLESPDPSLNSADSENRSDSQSHSQFDSQLDAQERAQSSPAAAATSGLTLHLLLQLPDPQRELINWMLRQPDDCTFSEIREYLQQDEAETRSLLDTLLNAGFMQTYLQNHQTYYQVQMRSMRQSRQFQFQQFQSQ